MTIFKKWIINIIIVFCQIMLSLLLVSVLYTIIRAPHLREMTF